MADEWIPIELYGPNGDGGKRRVTIADGVSVSVGALLQLLDPRTASGGHLPANPVAGVAAEEHLPNKGVLSISVYTDGLFDVKAENGITLGAPVIAAAVNSNQVKELALSSFANFAASWAGVLGHALETGTNAEVINIRLGPL